MTREIFFKYCREHFGTSPDYPFEDNADAAVLRHGDNRKWYALLIRVPRRKFGLDDGGTADVVNLKLPAEMFGSFGKADGVYPAYHMNKLHWVSVLLADASDETVRFLTNASYEATKSRKGLKRGLRPRKERNSSPDA